MDWRLKLKFTGLPGPHWTPDLRTAAPGWAELEPARAIEACELVLPPGRILMAGFEAYNFFIEASRPLSGGAGRIEAAWLMGRSGAVSQVWRVTEGGILRYARPAGAEYGGGPTRGWRPGAGGSPKSLCLPKGAR